MAAPSETGKQAPDIKHNWGVDVKYLRTRLGGIAFRGRETSGKVRNMRSISENIGLWTEVVAEPYADVDETEFNGFTKTPAIIATLKNLQPLASPAVISLRNETMQRGRLFLRSADDVVVSYQLPDGSWKAENKLNLTLDDGMEDMDIRRLIVEDLRQRLGYKAGYIDPHTKCRNARVVAGESHMIEIDKPGFPFIGLLGDFEGYFSYSPLSDLETALYVMGYHKARKEFGSRIDVVMERVISNQPVNWKTNRQIQDLYDGPSIDTLFSINGAALWDSFVLRSKLRKSLGAEVGEPQFEENYYEQILLHQGTPTQRLPMIEQVVRRAECGFCYRGDAIAEVSGIAYKKLGVSEVGGWGRYADEMIKEGSTSLGLVLFGALEAQS